MRVEVVVGGVVGGFFFFFFNDPAPTEIYPLSLHDALPIWRQIAPAWATLRASAARASATASPTATPAAIAAPRSEEHTSELQSRLHLVCRLLLEKKKNNSVL